MGKSELVGVVLETLQTDWLGSLSKSYLCPVAVTIQTLLVKLLVSHTALEVGKAWLAGDTGGKKTSSAVDDTEAGFSESS